MVLTHTEKEQVVEEVWAKFKDALLATGREKLTVTGDGTILFFRDIALTQSIRGIPVIRGGVKLRVDARTGRILEFGAGFIPDRGLAEAPKLTAQQAADKLVAELEGAMIARKGSIRMGEHKTLAYLAMHDEMPAQLVWEMLVSYVMELGGDKVSDVVWVDAVDGTVAAREPADRYESVWVPSSGTAPDRNVYPAGIVQLTDAQIAANPVAVKVKENFATTSAKWNTFDPAYNGSGIRLVINYDMGSPNAVHNKVGGIDYLTFHKKTSLNWSMGDSLDTVAHEFGHAVAHSGLYFKPFGGMHHSAALDEAFADVSAVAVDSATNGVTTQTWRMSNGYRVTNPDWAIRSLSNPQDDYATSSFRNQIDWYPNLVAGELSPNATRHDNSTIVTHAFYLMSQGGYHVRAGQPQRTPEVTELIPSLYVAALPGGVTTARNIMLLAARSTALTNPAVGGQVTFEMLRAAAETAALNSYGPTASDSVHRAFQAVGMGASCGVATPATPTLTLINEHCNGKYTMTWNRMSYATWYEVKAYPALLGWDYAQVIGGGYRTECNTQVGATFGVRMRACNSCGCSDWTASQAMFYTPGCL